MAKRGLEAKRPCRDYMMTVCSIVLGMPTTTIFSGRVAGFPAFDFRRTAGACASPPTDEENIDLHLLEEIDHFADVLRTAGRAKDSAAEVVNLRKHFAA
jgi:hypothetical protein